jgi:hypothetical protein
LTDTNDELMVTTTITFNEEFITLETKPDEGYVTISNGYERIRMSPLVAQCLTDFMGTHSSWLIPVTFVKEEEDD